MTTEGGYDKVTDEVVVLLARIVGEANVLTGDERELLS